MFSIFKAGALKRVVQAARGKRAPQLLVGILGFALLARRDSAIATFLVLMAFDVLALCCADETAPHTAPPRLASALLIVAGAAASAALSARAARDSAAPRADHAAAAAAAG